MDVVTIERLGGFAGFGGPNLKSEGQISFSDLSPPDQAAVTGLFEPGRKTGPAKSPPAAIPDAFHYRLTRVIDGRPRSVEAPEEAVPAPLLASIRDSIR
jgi:hypothetical protein